MRGETGTENRFPDGCVAALKCLGIAIGRGEFCPVASWSAANSASELLPLALAASRMSRCRVVGAVPGQRGLCLEQRNGFR